MVTDSGEGKLRTANVLLADLKQMFRFALARDVVIRNSLETVLERDVGGASVERDRVLSAAEFASLGRQAKCRGRRASGKCARPRCIAFAIHSSS